MAAGKRAEVMHRRRGVAANLFQRVAVSTTSCFSGRPKNFCCAKSILFALPDLRNPFTTALAFVISGPNSYKAEVCDKKKQKKEGVPPELW
jgi:hypothetical protein